MQSYFKEPDFIYCIIYTKRSGLSYQWMTVLKRLEQNLNIILSGNKPMQ